MPEMPLRNIRAFLKKRCCKEVNLVRLVGPFHAGSMNALFKEENSMNLKKLAP